jgi:hypothetical protein
MNTASNSSLDLASIANKLRAGESSPVNGGYSPARRGIVLLADGSAVFAKQAVDASSTAALQKEFELYQFLEAAGYPHVPKVLGYAQDTLVLPDLRGWDWSPRWTQRKLDAVLAAMQALGRLTPGEDIRPLLKPGVPAELEKCWNLLVPDENWTAVQKILQANPKTPRSLLNLSIAQRQEIVGRVTPQVFECGELTHCDIRADNCAYNPATQELLIVDWNWAELGSFALDRSAFLVSVLREIELSSMTHQNKIELSAEKVAGLIDPRSALALAGFWLWYAAQPPLEPGDPRGLRKLQLESGLLAWERGQAACSG